MIRSLQPLLPIFFAPKTNGKVVCLPECRCRWCQPSDLPPNERIFLLTLLGINPQMPQSPSRPPSMAADAVKRSSLTPGFRPPGHMHQQYQASPLQNTLTPPPPDVFEANEPFPSVESSLDSGIAGQNFHIPASGLSASGSANNDTSPVQHQAHHYQHSQSSSWGSRSDSLEVFCASCGRPWLLKNCFACTECICACCSDCVGQILSSPNVTVQPSVAPIRRGCPRCSVMSGKWKRFQLDFR